jgi:hypothetical protein
LCDFFFRIHTGQWRAAENHYTARSNMVDFLLASEYNIGTTERKMMGVNTDIPLDRDRKLLFLLELKCMMANSRLGQEPGIM